MNTREPSMAALVFVLAILALAPTAEAQITIKTDEPLLLVSGETRVVFTPDWEARAEEPSGDPACDDPLGNYLQKVIIQNPGDGAQTARVVVDAVGPTGPAYTVGRIRTDCDRFLIFEAMRSRPSGRGAFSASLGDIVAALH